MKTRHSLLLLLPLLLLCACRPAAEPAKKPRVTVSIEPLRYFVEAIAGDHVEVQTLLPKGSTPETYEPTARQIMELDHSAALVRVGSLGFERTRLRRVAANAAHLYTVDASKEVEMIPHDQGCCSSEGTDPHIWMSTQNAKIISTNIFQALCAIDTVNTDYYTTRYNALKQRLDSLDTAIELLLTDCPNRAFLIQHPALGYFARDYNLHQFSIEHDGKEPSPEHLMHIIDNARRENIKLIFLQKGQPGRLAQRIAEETGATVVEVNPLAYDWEAEMLKTAKALAQ